MVPPIDSLQKRISTPAPSKTPLRPLARRTGWRRGAGRLGQDVVGELDDACTERGGLARFIVVIRLAEIRGVFLAYDRISWEGLREDDVDDGLCGIVRHFFF